MASWRKERDLFLHIVLVMLCAGHMESFPFSLSACDYSDWLVTVHPKFHPLNVQTEEEKAPGRTSSSLPVP